MKKIMPFFKLVCLFLSVISVNTVKGQHTAPNGKKEIIFLCPPCDLYCDTIQFKQPGGCPICGMRLFASYKEYANKKGKYLTSIKKNVAVLLFPGVEIIDFAGPWEVFGAAGMHVYSVAQNDSTIVTSMGLKIQPDHIFVTAPKPDIILIPGGNVDVSDTTVVNWIKKMNEISEHTLSVCTGAFYLAYGGLLDNLKATTNYPAIPSLKRIAKRTTILDSVRFVDNGHIITSAGLSAGIDAALYVVSLYLGKAQTKKIANDLEYNWNDETEFVRGNLAEKYFQGVLDLFTPFDYTLEVYKGDEHKWTIELKLQTDLSYVDLRRLILYQLEQVNGWHLLAKNQTLVLSADGKNFTASAKIVPIEDKRYNIKLDVKRDVAKKVK